MEVTNVRVSFMREKQPAQYEKAQPAVEFAAVLEGDDDYVLVARKLMLDAAATVYAGIGFPTPERVVEALMSGGTLAASEGTGVVKTETTPAAEEKTVETTPPTEEKPAETKRRGRPPGSKNTRPKAGTKAAKAAEEATKAASNDGLPPEDDDAPQIRTNPENRVDPNDLPPEDDSPSTAPAADTAQADYTAKDFHADINSAVQSKKLSLPNAKQILVHFRVARAQDLTPEQVVEGKAMLDKMIEASA